MGIAFSSIDGGYERITYAQNFGFGANAEDLMGMIHTYFSYQWTSDPYSSGTQNGYTYTLTSPKGYQAKVDLWWDSVVSNSVFLRMKSFSGSPAGNFHRLAVVGLSQSYNLWINPCSAFIWPYDNRQGIGAGNRAVALIVPWLPEQLVPGSTDPCALDYFGDDLTEVWISMGDRTGTCFIDKSYQYRDWVVGVNGLTRAESETQDGGFATAGFGQGIGNLSIPIQIPGGKGEVGGGRNSRYYDHSTPGTPGLRRGIRQPIYYKFAPLTAVTAAMSQQDWLNLPGIVHGQQYDGFIEGLYHPANSVQTVEVDVDGGGTVERDFICITYTPTLTGGLNDDGVGYSLWLLKPDPIRRRNYAL